MEARLPLLRKLEGYPDKHVAEFASDEGARLKAEAEQERKWETERDKLTDERFE